MRLKMLLMSLALLFLLSTVSLPLLLRRGEGSPVTTLSVSPQTTTALIGETFVVNVTVTDVFDLYAYEFKVSYDTAMLNATHVTIQPFLNEPTVVVVEEINETLGIVWIGITSRNPVEIGVSGNATLATIIFRVVATATGSCVLDIYDSILSDSDIIAMDHDVVDGSVVIPGCCFVWKSVIYNVIVLSESVIDGFGFNHSLGQISFDVVSTEPGLCNVTIPKGLLDGAFMVLTNDTRAASIIGWNQTHTFIHFNCSQGTHHVKVIGEVVTRIGGDIDRDGDVDIFDIIAAARNFGKTNY